MVKILVENSVNCNKMLILKSFWLCSLLIILVLIKIFLIYAGVRRFKLYVQYRIMQITKLPAPCNIYFVIKAGVYKSLALDGPRTCIFYCNT